MPLEYPIDNASKGVIEQTKFAELKALKFKGGLPVFSAIPTYTGSDGELVLLYSTGTYQLYSYLNKGWRNIGGGGSAGSLSNIVEDITPQLGGDLDLNGKSIDFPTTPNISDVLDEDTMVSNSATKLATQQSIKAYVDSKTLSYSAGDFLLIGDSTEVSNNVTANDTKVGEFKLNNGGTLRIKFDLKIATGGGGSEAYAQIYRNGVAVGTRQEDDSSTNYVTFSEDISGWSAGDLVQLYSKTSNASYPAYTKGFYLYTTDFVGRSVSECSGGTKLESSADTERTITDNSYTLVKEIVVGGRGTLRIKFDLKSETATKTAYGRIYKNGVAIGSEQTNASTDYATKTEDITGWVKGDLCQLYCKEQSGGGYYVGVRNFRIYTDQYDWAVNTD